MDITGITHRVYKVISDEWALALDVVTPELTLLDLGADSLDKFELAIGLEDEFGIVIADSDAMEFASVAGIVSYVIDRMRTRQ